MPTTQIIETYNANTTPRFKRLEELWRWVEGSQYDKLPSFWDESCPLWERKPCIVYPVARVAAESNTDLVLGEGRFPVFTSKPSEDETKGEKAISREPGKPASEQPKPKPVAKDSDNGLDEESSVVLDRFIVEYHKLCQFRAHSREAFQHGQGTGTAVGLHGYRTDGKPFAELIEAKTATPKLNASGEVESVEIRYPYIDEYKDPVDGKWKERVLLYRRTIDAQSDVVYAPAVARPDGLEPNWTPQSTTAHNLGFCPVVWYPFMRGCVPVNVIDGNAVHARLTDEIQGLDIALSEKHRCALLSEPQIVEIGVNPGESPTDVGRQPMVPSTPDGGHRSPNNPVNGGWGGSTPAARKKGPGYVWQYPNPLTKVDALTIPSDALEGLALHCQDLKSKIEDSLAVVLLDPDNLKFATTTSGKALEALKQRQIDRCDQYRDDLRDRFLIPSVNMQLRIALKAGDRLRVPGIKEAQKILAKFEKPDVAAPQPTA